MSRQGMVCQISYKVSTADLVRAGPELKGKHHTEQMPRTSISQPLLFCLKNLSRCRQMPCRPEAKTSHDVATLSTAYQQGESSHTKEGVGNAHRAPRVELDSSCERRPVAWGAFLRRGANANGSGEVPLGKASDRRAPEQRCRLKERRKITGRLPCSEIEADG